MPKDTSPLIRRLAGGDPFAGAAILAEAEGAAAPDVLVAAALIRGDPALLGRATAEARTPAGRQLSAIAAARLRGDDDLVDALLRDHLADHPDSVLGTWIAAAVRPTPSDPDRRPAQTQE